MSTSTSTAPTITAADIRDTIIRMQEMLWADCPFVAWMDRAGCHPRDGWRLYVPQSIAKLAGGQLPSYVRVHTIGDAFGMVAINTRDLRPILDLPDNDLAMLGRRL